MGLAWTLTSGLLWFGLNARGAGPALGVIALFTLGFWGTVWPRLRRPLDLAGALPWLIFAAPAAPVLLALGAGNRGVDAVGLQDLLQIVPTLAVAHLLLRWIEGGLPHGYHRTRGVLLQAWPVGLCTVSAILLVARFYLFETAGHPEDSLYLWDCFRHWRDGLGPVSPWSETWGHSYPTHYFALHFSPILYVPFLVMRIVPHLATFLVLHVLFIGLGLVAWAAVLGRHPDGRPGEAFPAARLWTLALLAAIPPLNAALRTDVHPLLWALAPLALLHGSWQARRPVPFLVAGLALFAVREELGLVWAMYAPLSLLEGRRRRADLFWILAPLLGAVGTLMTLQVIIPLFGRVDTRFFQLVFGTTAPGLVPFLMSMLSQPGELVARVLRPAHLILIVRLLATGLCWPFGSWRWIPMLPLVALFSLVAPHLHLLRINGHYPVIPAIYLAAAGMAFLVPRLARLPERTREAALITLVTLGMVQPPGPELPRLEILLHPLEARRAVLEDMNLLDPNRPAWIPANLLVAAPRAEMAEPFHRLAILALDPDDPALPRQALLPSRAGHGEERIRLIEERFGPLELRVRGHHYDLYELTPRAPARH